MIKRLSVLVALSALGCGGSTMEITTPPIQNKIVFVTSGTYMGDLQTASGSSARGAAAGDAICATAAMAAQLGTQWKAWLSDSTANAIDRIEDVGPWYLTTGEKVFNNKANLATTALSPIASDENGKQVIGVSEVDGTETELVWTGTQTGGVSSGAHCSGWSSTDEEQYGTIGDFNTTASWTVSSVSSGARCAGYLMRLYCVQQ